MDSSGTIDGITVFSVPGSGFSIVVEGKPGLSGCFPSPCAFGVPSDTSECKPNQTSCVVDPTSLPDLQIEASNPLGNGSPAVCDSSGPNAGGVPAVFPITYDPNADPNLINTVNDLACRFIDGTGQPIGRGAQDACTIPNVSGQYGFVDPTSRIQFCAHISTVEQFPSGMTLVTVRLRDVVGNVGAPAQIIIDVP